MWLVSTSINGFAPIDDLDQLFTAEEKLERVAVQRLAENKYYPRIFRISGAQKLAPHSIHLS
jgi:hypothetical protein